MSNHETEQGADARQEEQSQQHARDRKMYVRFTLMIATSTTVMFVLMYTNVYVVDHVRWSEERFYMALLMAGAMALVMFAFMRSTMYRNPTYNVALVAVAVLLGAGGLFLSRSQVLVDDQAYMNGMIPHHSIAILTSERADIQDVRVRDLADGIIATQRTEIAQMDWLVRDIEENGPAEARDEAKQRPVPDFEARARGEVEDNDVLSALLGLTLVGHR